MAENDKAPTVTERLEALEKQNSDLKSELESTKVRFENRKSEDQPVLISTRRKGPPVGDSQIVVNDKTREIQKGKGLYNVSFLKDHGTYAKGDSAVYPKSTADMLAEHKIVKVGSKVEKVEKPKR